MEEDIKELARVISIIESLEGIIKNEEPLKLTTTTRLGDVSICNLPESMAEYILGHFANERAKLQEKLGICQKEIEP